MQWAQTTDPPSEQTETSQSFAINGINYIKNPKKPISHQEMFTLKQLHAKHATYIQYVLSNNLQQINFSIRTQCGSLH